MIGQLLFGVDYFVNFRTKRKNSRHFGRVTVMALIWVAPGGGEGDRARAHQVATRLASPTLVDFGVSDETTIKVSPQQSRHLVVCGPLVWMKEVEGFPQKLDVLVLVGLPPVLPDGVATLGALRSCLGASDCTRVALLTIGDDPTLKNQSCQWEGGMSKGCFLSLDMTADEEDIIHAVSVLLDQMKREPERSLNSFPPFDK